MTEILKEGGVYSLPRILSFVAFAVFVLVSLAMIVTGKTWSHYDTFAYITGGVPMGAVIGNKYVNSKYNTPMGALGKQL